MEMKEYCEDEELELCVGLYTGEDAEVFECGIHVIVQKTDSFEGSEWDHESEVGRDRAVIPTPPYMSQYARCNFFEIYGKQGLCNLSKNTKDRLLERIFSYHFLEYFIPFKAFFVPCDYSIIPKWFSYGGEGCSLSFDIPPDFEGLVIWAVCSGGTWHRELNAIIKNKSNGVQLFEATHAIPYFRSRWLRVISRREMAMEKYCGDAGLELHVILRSELCEVVRCGIHVIKTHPFGRSNYDQTPALDHDIYNQESFRLYNIHIFQKKNQESFEGSEGGHDIDYYETSFEGSGLSDHEIDHQEYSEVESDGTIPLPAYHLLHHPRHGSMRFSTRQQWKAF
uniref:TMV resistance protein N-like n=2 Tax=Populus alba TaxID=43335 RepID=A0A4U5P5Y2_POPAL|nr:TMV resistance protein N-like [Populus alba]